MLDYFLVVSYLDGDFIEMLLQLGDIFFQVGLVQPLLHFKLEVVPDLRLLPLQGFFERLVVFLGDVPTCNFSYMAMKSLAVSNLPTISFKMASIAELMDEWLDSLLCLQCSRML